MYVGFFVPCLPQLTPDILAVVYRNMDKRRDERRKAQSIIQSERRGQEHRRVLLVFIQVKGEVRPEDPRHIVCILGVVVCGRCVDRQVVRVEGPRICDSNSRDDEKDN